MRAFESSAVEAVYQSFPLLVRAKLLHLRELIFQTAASIERVGPLEENLKWGKPAYLTPVTKSGSTIRLGWKKSTPDEYGMYFNCKTSLIESFRLVLPEEFRYEGKRHRVQSERQHPDGHCRHVYRSRINLPFLP